MGLVETTIRVSDPAVSKAFYADEIGLEVVRERSDGEGGERHVYLGGDTPVEIRLRYVPDEEFETPTYGHVAVDDVDQVITVPKLHLSVLLDEAVHDVYSSIVDRFGDDVVIQEPIVESFEGGESQLAFVEDPDGHPIELNYRSGSDHPLMD